MLSGSRALVTGATGLIGANLMKRLLTDGVSVRGVYHEMAPVLDDERIDYVQADLTNPGDCAQVCEGVDYVFMCAANTSGAAVMVETPLVHVTPNVVMNALMLEAAHRASVKKFLFVSSSAAYPPTGDRPVREEEMFDGDPYDVYYAVGWMKRYVEVLCKVYAQKIKNPMSTVVIRPSNVYGPYDKFDFATSHMLAALIRRVVERQQPMEVWGTGDDVRDLIYIDDFIEGAMRAFEKTDDYLAINIASGEGRSVKQVLQTILEVDGYTDADVRFDPTKPTTIPVRLVDTTLAKNLLSFTPAVPFPDGIRQAIEWYREHEMARTRG